MPFTQLLIFDGAMGTMLHRHGMTHLAVPEVLNITHPDLIQGIHQAYLEQGADVVTTHTFGANRHKTALSGYSVDALITAAVGNAKAAVQGTDAKVALDIGPTGRLMKPVGDLSFDDAYELFAEQVRIGAACGADLILIETMSDLGEMRAAVLAAKEHSALPVYATMTFEEDGTTLTGSNPETVVLALEALGVDALGVNCSLGPEQLLPIVRRLLEFSTIPVMVQANAGLPRIDDGNVTYTVNEETFARFAGIFADEGVSIIGGCCGTTPEYIHLLQPIRPRFNPRQNAKRGPFLSSAQKCVPLDENILVIGERINPSGNKSIKEAFRADDLDPAIRLAFAQRDAGAHVLDICTDLPGIDSADLMRRLIDQLSGVIDTPLQFDSPDPALLEIALRRYHGVAILNSVNAKPESMARIFPLMKKYGAYAVALAMDENGIPKTADERVAAARKLLDEARRHGLSEDRFLVDPLVLTASAQQDLVTETLQAIRRLTEEFGVRTTLGLSNVSYGLPSRPLLNRTYLAMALACGLSSVIIDPGAPGVRDTLMAFNVLAGIDRDAQAYIQELGTTPQSIVSTATPSMTLDEALVKGDRTAVDALILPLLAAHDPLWVVENHLVVSLDQIGGAYERKELFLPQLIRAAETAGHAFQLVRKELLASDRTLETKGILALATVKGDVHDLGKNLVKVLLENYGFTVIDCGKDTSTAALIDTIQRHGIGLVGLSALMTTTVTNMADTIRELKDRFPHLKIFVGGAVLTEDYALKIGADAYGRDAKAAVSIARSHFSQ